LHLLNLSNKRFDRVKNKENFKLEKRNNARLITVIIDKTLNLDSKVLFL